MSSSKRDRDAPKDGVPFSPSLNDPHSKAPRVLQHHDALVTGEEGDSLHLTQLDQLLKNKQILDPEINDRDSLIQALYLAAEIEHMTMCMYLYAAYSMKKTEDEGITQAQMQLVRSWEGTFVLIARQEMLHLGHVSNLLLAIGGVPNFGCASFPQPPQFGAPQVWWTLEPFSLKTVARFIAIEAPEMTKKKNLNATEKEVIALLNEEKTRKLQLNQAIKFSGYQSIGALYGQIRKAFHTIPNLFIGSKEDQVTSATNEYVDAWMQGASTSPFFQHNAASMGLLPVFDIKTADTAIDAIVEEGEGSAKEEIAGHYGQFLEVFKQYKEELKKNARFEPARDMVSNPVIDLVNGVPRSGTTFITNKFTYKIIDIFNICYRALLFMLIRFFSFTKTADAIQIEKTAFFPMMTMGIRPLMEVLSILPAYEDDTKKERAGPNFDTTANVVLLPNVSSLHQVAELLQEASKKLNAIVQKDGELLKKYKCERLKFISESLMLLHNNFVTNMSIVPGYKEKELSRPKQMMKMTRVPQQQTKIVKPSKKLLAGGPPVASKFLTLKWEGWFQVRLATDPDPTDETRGVSGSTFATSSEPNFDRVLRFHPVPGKTTTRSHQHGTIGVFITEVYMGEKKINNHPLLGAKVELLDNPMFESRNNALDLSEREPLDPFELQISKEINGQTVKIRRKDVWDVTHPELTFLDPVIHNNATLSDRRRAKYTEIPSPIVALKTGVFNPAQFRADRADLLKKDIKAEQEKPKPNQTVIADLTRRHYELTHDIQPYLTKQGKLTWRRTDSFAINGPTDPKYNGKYYEITDPQEVLGGKVMPDGPAKGGGWQVNYSLGGYDSDCMIGWTDGQLTLPMM